MLPSNNDCIDDNDLDLPPLFPGAANAESARPRPIDSGAVLADAALEDALPRRLRNVVKAGAAVALFIETPSPAWTAALERAAHRLSPTATLITATKSSREVPSPPQLKWAAPLIVITSSPSWLSPALASAADHRIRIGPTPAIVRKALRRLTGRSAPVEITDLAGLDFPDLALAMRPGTTAASCVARLRRAARSRMVLPGRDNVPELPAIVGCDAARDALLEIVGEVDRLRKATTPCSDLPSLMLYGPPGTGKTRLARSLAKTAGLPIVATSVASWFTGSSGDLDGVAKASAAFFAAARQAAPSVAFIDEIDAIPNRETMSQRGRDWWTTIITGILLQIDELRRSDAAVLLIAATNHVDHLDAALKRPGRFDKMIEVLPPAAPEELAAVIREHLAGELSDAELLAAARLGLGATGAVAEGWVRAARQAVQAEGRGITADDLLAQIVPQDARTPEELYRVAVHEAGHATVACSLGVRVDTVGILSRGRSGGVTRIESLSSVPTREDIECHVMIGLAGRAAEELLLGSGSAGATQDLAIATTQIAAIHAVTGLGETLVAHAGMDEIRTVIAADPALRRQVNEDLERLMERTRTVVARHRRAIGELADRLVRQKVINDLAANGDALRDPLSGILKKVSPA